MQSLVLCFALFGIAGSKAHAHLQAGFARRQHATSVLGCLQRHICPLVAQLGQCLRNGQFDSFLRDVRKGVIGV